jgi:hypothetical protein
MTATVAAPAIHRRTPSLPLRALALVPLLALTTVWAQSSAQTSDASRKDEPVDEVIVRGNRTLGKMRLEVEQARERVFDEFNRYNSDDDFDIHCESKHLTGKLSKTRVCAPVYADKATAKAGKEFTRRIQHDCGNQMCEQGMRNGAVLAQEVQGRLGTLNKQLDDEFRRAALEHPELAKAIDEFVSKDRALREEVERRKE